MSVPIARARVAALVAAIVLGIVTLVVASPPRQQPPAQTFAQGARTGEPRMRHTATVLRDGRVLIVGGLEFGGIRLQSTLLFDPVTGNVSEAAPLHTARSSHTATLLADGRVLIAGGDVTPQKGQARPPLDRTEIFDPATGTFTEAAPMTSPRVFHSAVLLDDGRVLICGGLGSATGPGVIVHRTAEVFDPRTGRFTATASMTRQRLSPSATRLATNQVLITSDGTAELYDPRTGRFTVTSDPATNRREHTATLLDDGTVLLAGGLQPAIGPSIDSAELFDPKTNTFRATGTLRRSRGRHSATKLPDGRVLVTGGEHWAAEGGSYRSAIENTAEVYDPAAGTFSEAGRMSFPRALHASVLVRGAVWITGGSSSPLSERYPVDPAATVSAATAAAPPPPAVPPPANAPAQTAVAPPANVPPQTAGAPSPPGRGRSAGDFTPPVLIARTRPVYPSAAEAQRLTGTVEIEATIDATGAVQPRVVKPAHPLLDAAALEAVRQYRYLPATTGRRATTVSTSIPLVFQLDDVGAGATGANEPPITQARRFALLGATADLDRLLSQDGSLVTRDVPYLEPQGTGSLLHVTALYGQHNVPATIAALLAKGANVNARDVRGFTPLALALIRKQREQVFFAQDPASDELAALLLERGANARERYDGGLTPLLLATASGASAKTAALLLDNGADLNATTDGNATALMLAVSRTLDVEFVRLLLSRGARTDVRAQIDDGTALHRVFGAQATPDAVNAVVGLLVDAKANVRARNNAGTTPLLIAAWRGTPETIDRLIAAGADVNEANAPAAGASTPLHAAAVNGKTENVAALIRHSALVNAKDASGMTPMDLAQRAGYADVVKMLQAAPAR